MKTWLLGIALASALPSQTLDGVVVDQLTGAPVSGVYVRTHRAPYCITDAGGRFHLDSPVSSTETWPVFFDRSGYLLQQSIATLAPGEAVAAARIELTPQAVVSGTVEDEDGFPLQSPVSLLGYRLVNGRRQLKIIAGSATNDLGEFRIAGLVAGRYYLRVAPGRGAFYGAGRYADEYYPAGLHEAEAKPIDVRAVQEITGLRMRLKPNLGFRISGHIVLPPEYGSTATISVGLTNAEGNATLFSRGALVQPDGDRSFTWRNVAPGDYELRVGGGVSSVLSGTLYARLPVHVDQSDLSRLELRCHIAQPVDIPGKLIFAAGARPRAMSVILWGPGSPSARVGEDGTFVLKGIMPGSYTAGTLELTQTGRDRPFQPQSVRYAGREVPRRRIDLFAPPGGASLEITVADASAVLPVRALADPPDAAAVSWIYLVNSEGNYLYSVAMRGDQVRGLNLLPGEYRVFAARDSTYGQSADDPDFLAAHEKDMPLVRVQAGKNPLVELRVISR